ncbi:PAX-interacting protein 1-like protein [Dinothrombium tinctorium]|uniref:PAX-interacting protein 1 n=1 Tax=Dinothrombium tinctorium TaxID=1965070 RepID=A0A3S3QC41_9ACAR|nr:PAX-interacting protein 1-like protein [Dinothrombium tinctorium]
MILPVHQQQQLIQQPQQPVKMIQQGQQLIQLQRPLHHQQILAQGQTGIRTSSGIVFHQNQIMQQAVQRPQIQGMHQPSNTLGHPQVPRVPQLRVQPNYQQTQRGQFRSQLANQVVAGQRVYMKPPPQYPFQQTSDGNSPALRQQIPQQTRPLWPTQDNQSVSNQPQLVRPPQMVISPGTATTAQQMLQWQQEQQKKQMAAQQPVRLLQTTQRFQLPSGSDQVRLPSSTPSTTRSLQTSTTTAATSIQSTTQSQATTVSTSTCSSSTTSTSSAIVTPKTKTALANLLNTRLQNNTLGGGVNKLSVDTNSTNTNTTLNGSQAISHSGDGSSAAVSTVASDVASFSLVHNKLNCVGSSGVILSNGEFLHSRIASEQEKFYSHESKAMILPELCLVGCTFCLIEYDSPLFHIDDEMRDSCKKVIVKHGGEFEDSYSSKVTHVICETQKHCTVEQALKEGKRVVTIFWLNDVLEAKKLKPPWKSWHLPKGFNKDAKPCQSHIITTTNFTDEERSQIKELCKLVGARYTSYMCNKNTVLICKKLEGKKFRRAVEWGLNIVNLHWLSDVLLGNPTDDFLNAIASQKYKIFDLKDHFEFDLSLVRYLMSPWKVPIKLPDDLPKRLASYKADEFKPTTINQAVEEFTFASKASEMRSIKETNSENVKNGPKDSNALQPSAKRIKLTPEEEVTTNGMPLSRLPPPPPLTPAPYLGTTNPENARIKIMFTGFSQSTVENFKQIILKLGGRVTYNPLECTHLVVSEIKRTVKFLCAFNHTEYILSHRWLEECSKQNQFVNESLYWLNDMKNEDHFKFNLRDSIELRKARGTLLFRDLIAYVTKSCIPSPKVLMQIITSAGGIATDKPPNSGHLTRMRNNGKKFVVISSQSDSHLCERFFERGISVVNTEFVMSNILRQELDFDSYAIKNLVS